jgi:uncharacterized membrane protein YqaE (UPF0057 family)
MDKKREFAADFWRILIAYFIPPLGVALQVGLTGAFWLNLLLTLCVLVPGQIHALWIICTRGPRGKGVGPEGVANFWSIIIGYFLPPLGVALKRGLSGAFWLNLLLTLCFFVPGQIHALWVITHV